VEDFYDFLDLLNAQTRMNGGNYTRANTEDMLIATRGNGLERKNASVKQVIYSPLGEHREASRGAFPSGKLYGDVPRIELFSRCGAPGWDHWGNQAESAAVELIPGTVIPVINRRSVPHEPGNGERIQAEAKRCSDAIKSAMKVKPKPKFDSVSKPLLSKHYAKVKPWRVVREVCQCHWTPERALWSGVMMKLVLPFPPSVNTYWRAPNKPAGRTPSHQCCWPQISERCLRCDY
jgi:hypothetical protein